MDHVTNRSVEVQGSGVCVHTYVVRVVLPYSGLFSWGANFCYFRG